MNNTLLAYFLFALTLFGGYCIELTWRELFLDQRNPEIPTRFTRDDFWAHIYATAFVLLLTIGLNAWLEANYVWASGLSCFGFFSGASLADFVYLKHR
jgi:hypothetical protein